MLALQRQRETLKILEQDGAVRVADLAERFSVTEETIRRDLSMLENAGRVIRSHGGAVLAVSKLQEVPHRQRELINKEAKLSIAREAVKRISENDSILLDASSSAVFLAQLLPDHPMTVVTNSVLVAQVLADRQMIRVLSIGGVFMRETFSFYGPLAEKYLQEYHVGKLFFSCRGVDLQRGLTDPSDATARVKQEMIKIADERILLVDGSKFNLRALSVIDGVDAVHAVITDAEADTGFCDALRQRGIDVLQAGAEA